MPPRNNKTTCDIIIVKRGRATSLSTSQPIYRKRRVDSGSSVWVLTIVHSVHVFMCCEDKAYEKLKLRYSILFQSNDVMNMDKQRVNTFTWDDGRTKCSDINSWWKATKPISLDLLKSAFGITTYVVMLLVKKIFCMAAEYKVGDRRIRRIISQGSSIQAHPWTWYIKTHPPLADGSKEYTLRQKEVLLAVRQYKSGDSRRCLY